MRAAVRVLDGLVMDAVPDDGIVETGRCGFSDGENQSPIKRYLQKTRIEQKIISFEF